MASRKHAATAPAPKLTAETLLSLPEAAARLKVSPNTLRKAAHRGRLHLEHRVEKDGRKGSLVVRWGDAEAYRSSQKTMRSLAQQQRRQREIVAQKAKLAEITAQNLAQREHLLAHPGEATMLIPARQMEGRRKRGTYLIPTQVQVSTMEPEPEAVVEAAEEPAVLAAPEAEVEATPEPAPEPATFTTIRDVSQHMLELNERLLALTEQRERVAREMATLTEMVLHWDRRPLISVPSEDEPVTVG